MNLIGTVFAPICGLRNCYDALDCRMPHFFPVMGEVGLTSRPSAQISREAVASCGSPQRGPLSQLPLSQEYPVRGLARAASPQ